MTTLEHVLKLAVAYRAQSIKGEGFEIVMSPLAFALPERAGDVSGKDAPPERELTDLEMLLWSAGGELPDVAAKPPVEP